MKPVVIFDVDKTFITSDLPDYLYRQRIFKRKIRAKDIFYAAFFFIMFHCTRWKARRRFEYWYEGFIDSERVCEIVESHELVNESVRRRFLKYLKLGYDIYFVTAAPRAIAIRLSSLYDVQVKASKTFRGFIINDLMGCKENKVYSEISKNATIVAIYSDSKPDHSTLARYNYIVRDSGIYLDREKRVNRNYCSVTTVNV